MKTDFEVGKIVNFENRDLLPAGWAQERSVDEFFITNPSIQRYAGRWLMAYKVVTPGYQKERFAICRLDENYGVIAGSAVPLSDTIPNVMPQVGDPRVLIYAGRLWVLYCHFRLPSMLYLAEIDPDTLQAAGPSRPLLLENRQWQEKNWMLFEYEGDLMAVYTIAPHVVLQLDIQPGSADIRCRRIHTTHWDASAYARRYGEPRGGALPVRVGDAYYSFFHSRYYISRVHTLLAPAWYGLRARLGRPEHWQGPRLVTGDVRPLQTSTSWIYSPRPLPFRLDGLLRRYEASFARRHYAMGVYGFQAKPPFTPIAISPAPILYPEVEQAPRRGSRLSPLNDRVVFVSGAVSLENQRWLISYGLHDERCMVREVTLDPGF